MRRSFKSHARCAEPGELQTAPPSGRRGVPVLPQRDLPQRPPIRSDNRATSLPITLRNQNPHRRTARRMPSQTPIKLKSMALRPGARTVATTPKSMEERQAQLHRQDRCHQQTKSQSPRIRRRNTQDAAETPRIWSAHSSLTRTCYMSRHDRAGRPTYARLGRSGQRLANADGYVISAGAARAGWRFAGESPIQYGNRLL